MSTSIVSMAEQDMENSGQSSAKEPHQRVERRARRRAKITALVHVRGTYETVEGFEEVCKTVDVSRDGLLFTTRHSGFAKGQIIDVTFPYSDFPGAQNQAQQAQVIRVVPRPAGKVAVAVCFLVAKATAKAERKQAAASSPIAGGVTKIAVERLKQCIVLAVEPDEHIAEMMRTVLGPDGYTVVIVATAKAALEYLSTTVPDVFLAEVEAEDMSGQDLCVIIKQNERLARVPVILLTRSGEPTDSSASHRLGAVVCMAKPFQPERLQQVVRLVAPPPSMRSVYGARLSANASFDRRFS
jgi:CheY-like chemotaxis protein